MKPEKSDQTDEGYVEQRFEEPLFMKDWSDDHTIMHTAIKDSKSSREIIAIATSRFHSNLTSLTCMSRVNKRWKLICEDQTLWRSLFYASGWSANQTSIDRYLSSLPTPSSDESIQHTIPQKTVSSIPLARTTASLYNPAALPMMPGAPTTRLKPFKRSTDLFFDKILRHNSNNNASSSSNNPYRSTNRHIEDGVGNSSVALRPTQNDRLLIDLLHDCMQNTMKLLYITTMRNKTFDSSIGSDCTVIAV
ncbi:hypothetical protein G6F42_020931 [Rhizopus arrhizus]|nr:hypothetical protein G6F42_020931 [Rhizopus arrhizus]